MSKQSAQFGLSAVMANVRSAFWMTDGPIGEVAAVLSTHARPVSA